MAVLFNSSLNREYRVVVQPYHYQRGRYKRWAISANSLSNYIGAQNANTAFVKASVSRSDKVRLKFRSFGIVDIYLK